MKVESYHPSGILKPFINSFKIIESEVQITGNLLPGTSIVMAFRYRGTIKDLHAEPSHSFPLSAITGLRKSSRLFNYSHDTAVLLVMFNEGGAGAFFRQPLHDFFGESISLDAVLPCTLTREIEERLAGANDNLQRITIVEQWLMAQLNDYTADTRVLEAVQKIKAARGIIKIKELASQLYMSQDSFEKKFRSMVGASPKQFSSVVRLRYVIDQYPRLQNLSLAAIKAGYFDQAHFIKDFKTFTGKTPHEFFSNAAYW